MKLIEYIDEITSFLKKYLNDSPTDGYVIGLSGGVDSSFVAALLKKAVGKEKMIGIMIPIDSLEEDLNDAKALANHLNIDYLVIDGSETFHSLKDEFKKNGIVLTTMTSSNLKARIRMSILYAIAQQKNFLVCGTDNWDERYIGYFTKHGDGAADVMPISHLLKSEVVEGAKILGLPSYLAERVPSAGLYIGQTDEKELGVKYSEIDNFLLNKPISEESKKRIQHLHKISEHKRSEAPSPIDFKRD